MAAIVQHFPSYKLDLFMRLITPFGFGDLEAFSFVYGQLCAMIELHGTFGAPKTIVVCVEVIPQVMYSVAHFLTNLTRPLTIEMAQLVFY